jgi:hypothetical protein
MGNPANEPHGTVQRAVRHSAIIVLLVALAGVTMWGALRTIERGRVEKLITQYKQSPSSEVAGRLAAAVETKMASHKQAERIKALLAAKKDPNSVK